MSDPPQFTERRPLGRTGFSASILGIGDLADRAVPLDSCAAAVRRAIGAGLNVIDTAPNYEAGYSEEVVGHALRRVAIGGRRGMLVVPGRRTSVEPRPGPGVLL